MLRNKLKSALKVIPWIVPSEVNPLEFDAVQTAYPVFIEHSGVQSLSEINPRFTVSKLLQMRVPMHGSGQIRVKQFYIGLIMPELRERGKIVRLSTLNALYMAKRAPSGTAFRQEPIGSICDAVQAIIRICVIDFRRQSGIQFWMIDLFTVLDFDCIS